MKIFNLIKKMVIWVLIYFPLWVRDAMGLELSDYFVGRLWGDILTWIVGGTIWLLFCVYICH